jgi:hypothetical protein
LHGAFVRARGALHSPKRRFPARAVAVIGVKGRRAGGPAAGACASGACGRGRAGRAVATGEKDAVPAHKLAPASAYYRCIPMHRMHRNAWVSLHIVGQPDTLLAADRASQGPAGGGHRGPAPGPATKIAQGWPKFWPNFRARIGIFIQSVGPGLAVGVSRGRVLHKVLIRRTSQGLRVTATRDRVRKTLSWPRSWANFSF